MQNSNEFTDIYINCLSQFIFKALKDHSFSEINLNRCREEAYQMTSFLNNEMESFKNSNQYQSRPNLLLEEIGGSQ